MLDVGKTIGLNWKGICGCCCGCGWELVKTEGGIGWKYCCWGFTALKLNGGMIGGGTLGGNRSVGTKFVDCCCWEVEIGGGWIVLKDGIDVEEFEGTALGVVMNDDDDGLSVTLPKYL